MSVRSGSDMLYDMFVKGVLGSMIPFVDVSEPILQKNKSSKLVSKAGPYVLKVYNPFKDMNEFYKITKQTVFVQEEVDFIDSIINACVEEEEVFESNFCFEYIDSIIDREIARFVSSSCVDIISYIFLIYKNWSSQTYEGKRISHTLGVDCSIAKKSSISFLKVCNTGYSKLIGASYNTLLSLNKDGEVCSLVNLGDVKPDDKERIYAPISMAHIASWASSEGKIALSLTRNGEILIFKNKEMIFAKRRGRWLYFSHKMIVDKLTHGRTGDLAKKIREAVYLTSIDVSFSRSGGCIGIVEDEKDINTIMKLSDKFSCNKRTSQAACLSYVCGKKRFHNIPRSIRAEICAVDGALVIDSQGRIITAGSILKTSGSSGSGGGRTAAAKELGKKGLGVKISNDGNITLFTMKKEMSFG